MPPVSTGGWKGGGGSLVGHLLIDFVLDSKDGEWYLNNYIPDIPEVWKISLKQKPSRVETVVKRLQTISVIRWMLIKVQTCLDTFNCCVNVSTLLDKINLNFHRSVAPPDPRI